MKKQVHWVVFDAFHEAIETYENNQKMIEQQYEKSAK